MIDVSELEEILEQEKVKAQIEKVEIYYNSYTTVKLVGAKEGDVVKELF